MFDNETMNTIIKAAVVGALGEKAANKVLDDIVTRMLGSKVNKHGDTSYTNHGGHPDTPFLDYLVDRELRVLIEGAVREHIQNNMPEIKEQIQKAIVGTDGLANGITELLSRQLADGYLSINVDIKKI